MADPMPKHAFNHPSREEDQRLEVAIGMLLRIGVSLAAVLVLIGGIMTLRHPGTPVPDYRVFQPSGAPSAPGIGGSAMHSIHGVFRQLGAGSGASIIALGLLVLIATPIARVLFAMIGFARERDMLYTVVSFIVLAVLVFSLLHGR